MMSVMRRYLIGGESGKREATLAVFLLVAAVLVFAVYQEARGVVMDETWGFLVLAFPSSVGALLAAHGLEHMRPHGGAAKPRVTPEDARRAG